MPVESTRFSEASPAQDAFVAGVAVFALSTAISRLYTQSYPKRLMVGAGLGGAVALPVGLVVKHLKDKAVAELEEARRVEEKEADRRAEEGRRAEAGRSAHDDPSVDADLARALEMSQRDVGGSSVPTRDTPPPGKSVPKIPEERRNYVALQVPPTTRFDSRVDGQYRAALQSADSSLSRRQIDQAVLTALRARELQKQLEPTHYVFFHGQSTPYLPILYAIDKLADMIHEGVRAKRNHFIRFPAWPMPDAKVELAKYKQTYTDDHQCRRQLVSVSPRISNGDAGESALAFLGQNRNVASAAVMPFDEVIRGVFRDFRDNVDTALDDGAFQRASQNLARICSSLSGQGTSGNLLLVAIPKDQIQDVAYRAHPYGKACTCHPPSQDISILDALQQESFPSRFECTQQTVYRNGFSYQTPKTPQYRLLTSQLIPIDGKQIYLISPLSKDVRQDLKRQVGEALRPIFA